MRAPHWQGVGLAITIAILLPGAIPAEAVSDDPLEDLSECAGALMRVAFRGHLTPLIEIPGLPHQGVVSHAPTSTFGVFLLEGDQNHVASVDEENDDNLIWYLMSGTAGEYEKCEELADASG